MPRPLIDTYARVETPEAIDIQLRPASVHVRARAYMVDWLLRLVWLGVSSIILVLIFRPSGTDNFFWGFFLLNLFATTWLYPILFEVWWNGQTPGKKIFKIRAVMDTGADISWSASLLRNLLRLLDGLPFAYGVGMVCMLLHPHSKRLGDIYSGSLIVYAQEAMQISTLKGLDHINPLVSPVPLTRTEQSAVVAFAERHRKLPLPRQQELAEQLVDTLGLPPVRAIETVLGLAKHILGSRTEAGR